MFSSNLKYTGYKTDNIQEKPSWFLLAKCSVTQVQIQYYNWLIIFLANTVVVLLCGKKEIKRAKIRIKCSLPVCNKIFTSSAFIFSCITIIKLANDFAGTIW